MRSFYLAFYCARKLWKLAVMLVMLVMLHDITGANAQSRPDNTPPLSLVPGARYVIKQHFRLEESPAYTGPAQDTDAIYSIDRAGRVDTAFAYLRSTDSWTVHIYGYGGTGLIHDLTYDAPASTGWLALPTPESLAYRRKTLWTYEDGSRRITEQHYGTRHPDEPTSVTRFVYDRRQRLRSRVRSYFQRPDEPLTYGQKDDSVTYTYAGDQRTTTVYTASGEPRVSTYRYVLDKEGRLLDYFETSPDGRHYQGERYSYDQAGRLLHYHDTSDFAPVQADGIVLRADEVIHTYGSSGRPAEAVYLALGKPRWRVVYVYVERKRP